MAHGKVLSFRPTARSRVVVAQMIQALEAQGVRPTIAAVVDLLARAHDNHGIVSLSDAAASGFASGFASGVKDANRRVHEAMKSALVVPADEPHFRRRAR